MGPVQLARHYRKAREGVSRNRPVITRRTARAVRAQRSFASTPSSVRRRRRRRTAAGRSSRRCDGATCPGSPSGTALAHGREQSLAGGEPTTPAAVPPSPRPTSYRSSHRVRPPTGPRPGRRATLNVGTRRTGRPPADPAGGPTTRGLPRSCPPMPPDSVPRPPGARAEVRLPSGGRPRRTPCVDTLITGRIDFAPQFLARREGTSLPSRRLTVWGHPCLARTF